MKFIIKGKPLAKARPFFSTKGGKVRAFTPNTTTSYENLVKITAQTYFKTPLTGAISLSIHFLLPRPKYLYWKRKPMFACYCDKRPDIDNLAKAVIDGLNGVAFKDDGQISVLHITKMYHSGDEGPRTEIEVEELNE